ncbi:HlyC/CorC family transporter [Clostridium botulinum]|uniref:CBS/transporter domain protein n=1 Tax=Clostridium botulinum (strain Eklund 17B / Type B) TaxID=935198 RepID=B2TR44_CLOBB|nr:CBS/transporter domain protein [Clostridium botulinum B str. Eklund 17B (NRP)]MBY6977677.1 HlyC/CorC family transporter [Clostridium botulinum]MBY7002141.1 HlyC/CorC family transporter [Clostridium botulinum]MCR1275808.1 hemolysin family protein [Clostridium botulinum]NFD71386.1 HlyC/CorC family transporter [Clostridium botulinum]
MQPEAGSVNITSQIILIVILTLVNAFFASAEMAIVSLNKNKIKLLAEEGNKKAITLLKLMEEPTKFLSTIQVGITLAGFFNSASAATGISQDLARYLSGLNVPYSNKIALIIVTVIISYITLVFGELFPKRIALKKSETIAMFSVRPILYVSKITAPFIKLLSASTNILVSLAGLDKEGLDEKVSKEEIKSLVEVGQEHGVINETEKEMINSIFEFDDKLADEVMTPRTEVYLINIDKPLEEYLDELLEEKYSRVPVYEEDIDNIIGILYMKDFILEARKHEFENVNIREILHSPYFVPETKNIDDLFNELKSYKKHMAILIDEYGGFSGIVTIEDLVEEVMGNIDDEYDEEECFIQKIDSSTFIVNGLMPIDDLNDYLHIQLVSDECDTISGFLINIMGKIPNNIEEKVIEYENIIFKIESIKEKRIEKIKICIQNDK